VLGGLSMKTGTGVPRLIGALTTALIGAGFFFAIVGVFGLPVAIGTGIVFIVLALLIFRRPQAEGMR